MSQIRSSGNKSTELALILQLKEYGITGWRRKVKLLGKPDFVFPKLKLAIFVDGCFWHGCKKHLRIPHNNKDYWIKKVSANIFRDKSISNKLRKSGWRVLRVWEHEIPNRQGLKRIRKTIEG